MKSGKYTILRAREADLRDPFGGFKISESAGGAPSVSIEESSLTKSDINDLRRDPSVRGIAPAMPVALIEPFAVTTGDGNVEPGATWGVHAVRAAESPYAGQGVTVAVLDTGIDAAHEAFAGVNLVQNDFTGEGDGDDNGHGTHCAGTVFGQAAQNFRFGIAPGIKKALIGKVLGRNGGGSTDQIFKAMQWSVDNGAHIVSMSLGMDFPGFVTRLTAQGFPQDLAVSKALEGYRANVRLFDTLMQLVQARGPFSGGTVFVAATGNESKREVDPDYELAVAPPAAADGIIACGALGTKNGDISKLAVADFSNTGANLTAPGVAVHSAKPGGGYRKLSGTSMATPHLAGVAALWAEKLLKDAGRVAPLELIGALLGNAVKTPIVGFDSLDAGAGLVQSPLT